MAGGTFIKHDKRRPGAYINVKAPNRKGGVTGSRGVVFFVGGNVLGWGPNGIITLSPDSDFKQLLGVDLDADLFGVTSEATADGAVVKIDEKKKGVLTALHETLKGALKVLYYNINVGKTAEFKDDKLPWDFKALYPGETGNQITVGVSPNPAKAGTVIVTTYFGTEAVNKQTVKTASQLKGTEYTAVSVTDAAKADDGKALITGLTNGITSPLAGGTTDTTSEVDADALINTLETQQFAILTAAGYADDAPIHALLANTVKRLREEAGQKVQVVVPDTAGSDYDYEGVIVVANGVVLSDGTQLSATEAAGYIAGVESAVPLNQSLTYAVYPSASDVIGRLNNEDTILALNDGKLLFTPRNDGSVVIEQDINSFHNFTQDKRSDLAKNRVIRVLDDIAQNTKDTFETAFIGKITNNGAGRDLFKSNRVEYLNGLVTSGALGAFDAADISVDPGEDLDTVVVNLAVTPADAMEKLYMTVTV